MWSGFLGHTAQIAQIRQSIAQGTFAQAYLFSGPDGVGKRAIAVAAAAELAHAERARIANHQHPDVVCVAPSAEKALREITIDQIRTMQARLQFHPLECDVKIAIIDDAETMHPSAANACLKILEEPPARTHFLLISASPHRLLPTIRSRCQTIAFGPLSTETIAQSLVQQGIDAAEARQRAVLSEGSLGQALHFPADILPETMTDVHHVLTAPQAATVLTVAERWAADAAVLPHRLQLLGLLWRDALATRLGRTAPPTLPATHALIQRLLPRSPYRLHTELAATLHTSRDVANTTLNKQLCCEALLFRLAAA